MSEYGNHERKLAYARAALEAAEEWSREEDIGAIRYRCQLLHKALIRTTNSYERLLRYTDEELLEQVASAAELGPPDLIEREK